MKYSREPELTPRHRVGRERATARRVNRNTFANGRYGPTSEPILGRFPSIGSTTSGHSSSTATAPAECRSSAATADPEHRGERRVQRDRADQTPGVRVDKRQVRARQRRGHQRATTTATIIITAAYTAENTAATMAFATSTKRAIRGGHERRADHAAAVFTRHRHRREDHQHRHAEHRHADRRPLRRQRRRTVCASTPCSAARPMLSTATAAAVHSTDRVVDSLIRSASVRRPRSLADRPVLGGLVGELHVGLLQRGPLCAQLVQGDRVAGGEVADDLDRRATHQQRRAVVGLASSARRRSSTRRSVSSCGLRTRTVSAPERPTNSLTVVDAISLPLPMTTSRSAVLAISASRWLDTNTVRPSAGQRAHQRADPADALGVEAVDRLVEQQHRRVAEQRGGDAEPLAHAQRERAGLLARHRPSGRPCRAPRRPAWPGSGWSAAIQRR